jgi:hypothetical protein
MASPSRHLYLLDLRSGERVRRLMRETMARWLRVRRVLSGGRAELALVPVSRYGDATAAPWPDDVEVLYPNDLLDQDDLLASCDWTRECGFALVRGGPPELFPTVLGVHLGVLNTSYIWAKLTMYVNLADAARAALRVQPGQRCTVVTSVPPIARSLRRDLSAYASRVRTLSLPSRGGGRRPPASSPAAPAAVRPATDALPANLADAAPRRVLVVSHTPAMARMFELVERCLRAEGIDSLLRVQYGPEERPVEERDGISVAHVRRPPASAADVAEYARLWWEVARPHFERMERDGTTALPGYTPPLVTTFEDVYLEHFPAQAARIREAAAVLDRVAPELVVVGNDRWWEDKTYVLLARERGIPTMCVQDGADGMAPTWYWSDSDYVATQSEMLPERLAHAGYDARRTRVTGQPRFDALFDAARRADREASRARLGLPAGFWVLFATQYDHDASILERVARAVLDVPGGQLAIRPHPEVDPSLYAAVVAAHPDGRVRLLQGDMADSLAACDAVVAQTSTVSVEAAILERPLVLINFTGLVDIVPFAEVGIGVRVGTPAELTTQLRRVAAGEAILDPEVRRAGLKRLVGPLDARASERVAAFVREVLERGRPAAPHDEAGAAGAASR